MLYESGQPRLSPLYDAIPVVIYPQLDHHLAMAVGGTKKPHELVEKRWRQFAHDAALDPDQACQEAFTVIAKVSDIYEQHMEEADINPTRLRAVRKHVSAMRTTFPRDF